MEQYDGGTRRFTSWGTPCRIIKKEDMCMGEFINKLKNSPLPMLKEKSSGRLLIVFVISDETVRVGGIDYIYEQGNNVQAYALRDKFTYMDGSAIQ